MFSQLVAELSYLKMTSSLSLFFDIEMNVADYTPHIKFQGILELLRALKK